MLKIKRIEYFLLIVYGMLILLGIKEFIIWGQITELLTPNNMEANISVVSSIIAVGHPHVLRVLLIFPFYAISEYLSLNLDIFFSLTLMIMIFSTYWICISILRGIVTRKRLFILLVFFVILSFAMNGRIVFSVLGNTILLYLLYILADL